MCEQISCASQPLVMYVQHKSKKYTVFCIISMQWSGNVMQLLRAQLQHKPKYKVAPNIWQLHLSHWDIYRKYELIKFRNCNKNINKVSERQIKNWQQYV